MSYTNPFMPKVNEYYNVNPIDNESNMYYGILNRPITDYSGVHADLGLSKENPFGHGVQDIDWGGATWGKGSAPLIPKTGDAGFDQGLKIAIESGDSSNVIDFLNSSDKDLALAVEPYILDYMNTVRNQPVRGMKTQTQGSNYQPNPFTVERNNQQDPQMPMGGLQSFMGGQSPLAGGEAATGGEGGASGIMGDGGMSTLASNPYAWIVAAALGQNVLHNKGISSWQAGLKGQGGRNVGDHYLDKWGVDDDSKLRDVAGALGWGSGGGILNPSYLPTKLFGKTD